MTLPMLATPSRRSTPTISATSCCAGASATCPRPRMARTSCGCARSATRRASARRWRLFLRAPPRAGAAATQRRRAAARAASASCWRAKGSPMRAKEKQSEHPEIVLPARPPFRPIRARPAKSSPALLRDGLIWTHTIPAGCPATPGSTSTAGNSSTSRRRSPQHLPPPPAKEQKPLPAIAGTLSGSARTCQRDLYLIWSTARETPLSTTNAELLRMADLKRLAGKLLVPETIATGTKESDYRRVLFLRRLLHALGLLQTGANGTHFRRRRSEILCQRAGRTGQTELPELARRLLVERAVGDLRSTASRAPRGASRTTPNPGSARRGARCWKRSCTLVHQEEMRQGTPTPWISLDMLSDTCTTTPRSSWWIAHGRADVRARMRTAGRATPPPTRPTNTTRWAGAGAASPTSRTRVEHGRARLYPRQSSRKGCIGWGWPTWATARKWRRKAACAAPPTPWPSA